MRRIWRRACNGPSRARAFAAYDALRAEIVDFDARRLGPRFALPLYFLQGADDVFTVSSEVRAYAAELTAPHVEYVSIAEAGHAAMLLRGDLLALLERHVRPALLAARKLPGTPLPD